jgi:two-component system, NarL family, response regulator LiaR
MNEMSDQQKIRVLLADDHEILRLGLSTFFESCDDMVLAGEAGNGQEALDLCQQVHPDVVLMDIAMPVMDGLTATGIIAQQYPEIAVIILTSSSSGEQQQEAHHAGASGYLHKSVDGDTIADVIRVAVQ